MKNFLKSLGIIFLVVIIGFGVAACGGNGGDNNNNDDETTDDGTTPSTPETMTSKSALQYFKDENVKMGWNLGNTLDAVNIPNAAVETAWGNPAATKTLIDGVKAQGFDIVRIDCTWIGHVGSAPDYTISEARLKRVAEVVNWVHAAGMKAIINIHHDGNYTSPPNTWGFLKFAEVQRGAADNSQVKDQLGKMWTQIANYFINYGDYLIFEVMNEVHSGDWGFGNNTSDQDRLLEWKQTALNAIRATGGNNATRFVAVPGLGSTEPSLVINAHSRGKLLPNDGSNGTKKIIVSVHFYAPSSYTVAEAAPTDPNATVLKHTLTSFELADIDTEAQHLKETFFNNGIAVYYGEWGAPTNVRASMDATIKNTHTDYIKRVAKAARSNGIIPIIWDDGGDFKMLERSNGSPKSGLWADTLTAYKAGIDEATWPAEGTTSPVTPTPPTNVTGNLGNYHFGVKDDNTTPNYKLAVWELSTANVTTATTAGAKLVLKLSAAPTASLDLVWQGPEINSWWNEKHILGATGSVLNASDATWNSGTNTLTINLSAAESYATFITQSALNLIIAYYGGDNVNALGITSANLE